MTKIRIKDIAQKAGVSVGTVDRVLHNRPNVSEKAFKKVNKALKEMEYCPNRHASALAYNKSFVFVLFMPRHNSEAYWQEIEEGAEKAEDMHADFHVNVKKVYYKRFDNDDFLRGADECMQQNPDGVIIVPSSLEVTRGFTDHLHKNNIPFVLLDSYMPDLRPLAFFGQDAFASGFFAARMLMFIARNDKRIMLIQQSRNGLPTSKQQANREVGFRHYMGDHHPEVEIITFVMPIDATEKQLYKMLDQFFCEHPDIHHCVTFNSKAHKIGEYLLANNKRDTQVMGYDMVPKNADCMRKGSISFLIAQHAFQQGFACVDVLFKAIVLKQFVEPVNYMPIELLTKENCDFYRRTLM